MGFDVTRCTLDNNYVDFPRTLDGSFADDANTLDAIHGSEQSIMRFNITLEEMIFNNTSEVMEYN